MTDRIDSVYDAADSAPGISAAARVNLTLARPTDVSDAITLSFLPLPSSVGVRWFGEVARANNEQLKVLHADRFYGFPGDWRTLGVVADQIIACISTINGYATDTIPPELARRTAELFHDAETPQHDLQQHLNRLHVYFETLRGSIETPALFFAQAPLAVRDALQKYNLQIHRVEDLLKEAQPRVVVAFEYARRRVPLNEEDFESFSLKMDFGHAYLNYCIVGKHLFELFSDADEICTGGNIRPQDKLSADTYIHFGQTSAEEQLAKLRNEFEQWWQSNASKLEALGFWYGDVRNAIGRCAVAALDRESPAIRGKSDDEIIAIVAQYQHIVSFVAADCDH